MAKKSTKKKKYEGNEFMVLVPCSNTKTKKSWEPGEYVTQNDLSVGDSVIENWLEIGVLNYVENITGQEPKSIDQEEGDSDG